MTDVINSTAARDALLAEVLEQYLQAAESGTAPDRAELLARHPELADQLQACLSSLDFIRRSGTPRSGGNSSARHGDLAEPPAARPSETPPPAGKLPADLLPREHVQLGDYRIVREIGRGGMGIVYEAQERSLGRRVALKVLPFAAALDPRQRLRFKNEAQAAALLQHPHIIPVLACGSEGEVNYFAMKFIEGRTLAQRIAERRLQMADLPTAGSASEESAIGSRQSPAAEVAHLGIQAAEALEEAHRAGIIHRDIKPANLLVEENGHLWVADFGLARFQHDAGSLTLTGDVIGTLRYMSPEQALAKHGIVDQRADVYSLGVTLYELATLHPAFDGSDRQELLHRILEEEPLPPRQIDKSIPLALETILLKACAKDPVRRYATAQAFADDLRRFRAGQAIAATRPGLVERAGRWARRHKAVVTTAVVVLLLALVGQAVSSIFIIRARNEAERRTEKTRHVVDDMYTQVAQRWWYQQPYMEQVQREFLVKAFAFYEDLSQERGDSRELRLEIARATRRVAEIQHRLGDHAKAEQAYDAAIVRLQQLADDSPDTACRDELANAQNNWANLLREERRFSEAEKVYRSAHELFVALAAERANPDYREGLAGSLNGLGIVLAVRGKPAAAEKVYREALDVLVALTRAQPTTPAYQHALAGCRNNLAVLLRDTNRPREALIAYEEAIAGWKKLSAQLPGMPIFRHQQAASHSGLGVVYAALGRECDAENAHRQALALRERLANEYPGVPAYGQALAGSQHSLGHLFAGQGRVKEARVFCAQALAVRKDLARRIPALSIYRQELADTHQILAALLSDLRQPHEAESHLREALALRTALAREKTQESQWDLARAQHELGTILRDLGRLQEAEPLYQSAITRLGKLSRSLPASRLEHAAARNDLALLYQRESRLEEAEQLHRSALKERDKLAAEFPQSPCCKMEAAVGQMLIASVFQDRGRGQEAEGACRRATALAEKLAADYPSQHQYIRLLSFAQEQLAELLIVAGKVTEAEQMLRQAARHLEKLSAQYPALPMYRHALARHEHAHGILLLRSGRHNDAEQAFQRELRLREQLAARYAEDPVLSRDLAYLLANGPEPKLRQSQRAIALAKEAIARNAHDAMTWYVFGLAHYRAGAWKEAVATLETTAPNRGKYAGGPFILAMAEWRLGHKERARDWLRRAVTALGQQPVLDYDLRELAAEAKLTVKMER